MIFIKQGDTRPAAPATIKHGESIVDLSLATSITFKMRKMSRIELTVDAAATVIDAAAGEVEYQWATGDTDSPDTYYAEWEVLWSDGTVETFPTIDHDIVVVRPDLDGS